jgi:hypothetical protein
VFTNNGLFDYVDTELTGLIKNRLKEDELFKHLDIEKIVIQIIATDKN